MAYFEDLSPYAYFSRNEVRSELNIGWLDSSHRFATGIVSSLIVERIKQMCSWAVRNSRGLHLCPFCAEHPVNYETPHGRLLLGSAEIRVFAENGDTFAAPNLILHYIAAHNYRPPSVFLDAIEKGDVPPSDEYLALLRIIDARAVELREMYPPA